MKRLIILLLLTANAALAADHFAVAVFKDRFTPPQRVDADKVPDDVEAVWLWTNDTPPRRVEINAVEQKQPTLPRWLTVHAEPARTREPLRLIAAPIAMWEEVPEDLLPSFPVKEKLRIPIDASSRWRVRLRGAKLGSWWIDVPPGASATRVTATAALDRSLQVRSEEGRGIAAIRLSVLDEGAERGDFRKLADYRSDAHGNFVLPSVPDTAGITLIFGSADRAPKVMATEPSAIPPRVILPRGSRVTGKLADSNGFPVAEANITLRAYASDTLPLPIIRRTTTAADGSWRIAALPEGKAEIEASALTFADLKQVVAIRGEVDLGTLTLQPAVAAELLVTDENGDAVSGATISAGAKTAAMTDGKGHASVKAAAGESLGLRVSAPHHRTKMVNIDSPPPKLSRIVLQRSFRVTGRFVDSSGGAIPEAHARSKSASKIETADVAPDGRFDLDLEPAADYHIELFSPTTAVAAVDVPKGNAGDVRDLGDVVAPRSLTIRGRLRRESDGVPVAGARVWLPRPSEAGPLMAWHSATFSRPPAARMENSSSPARRSFLSWSASPPPRSRPCGARSLPRTTRIASTSATSC